MKKILLIVAMVIFMIVPQTVNAIGSNGDVTKGFSGKASYYGKSHHGKKMANGKKFNMHNLTCAHKSLPFGTKLKVTNIDNGKTVIVEVTDRGPYAKGRVLDLSEKAFSEIASIKKGVTKVEVVELTTEMNLL